MSSYRYPNDVLDGRIVRCGLKLHVSTSRSYEQNGASLSQFRGPLRRNVKEVVIHGVQVLTFNRWRLCDLITNRRRKSRTDRARLGLPLRNSKWPIALVREYLSVGVSILCISVHVSLVEPGMEDDYSTDLRYHAEIDQVSDSQRHIIGWP